MPTRDELGADARQQSRECTSTRVRERNQQRRVTLCAIGHVAHQDRFATPATTSPFLPSELPLHFFALRGQAPCRGPAVSALGDRRLDVGALSAATLAERDTCGDREAADRPARAERLAEHQPSSDQRDRGTALMAVAARLAGSRLSAIAYSPNAPRLTNAPK